MPLTLYMIPASPPVRAVLLTAKALDVQLTTKTVNLLNKENLTPEYLKINPQHTVPTLVDDDFTIWDSHAIMGYLVAKYAKDDSLYPREPRQRAVIDQRMHFECGVLFPRLRAIAKAVLYENAKAVPKEEADAVHDAYKVLEKLLEGKQWAAGQSLSIADFSLISTVTTLNVLVPLKADQYPNIAAWMKRCEGLPYYEVNKTGLDQFAQLAKARLQG